MNGGGETTQWQNLWVEAQVQFNHPCKLVSLLTSQDKIRWKTPSRIEFERRDFILHNKHQSFKGNSEETLAIYPTHQILVK